MPWSAQSRYAQPSPAIPDPAMTTRGEFRPWPGDSWLQDVAASPVSPARTPAPPAPSRSRRVTDRVSRSSASSGPQPVPRARLDTACARRITEAPPEGPQVRKPGPNLHPRSRQESTSAHLSASTVQPLAESRADRPPADSIQVTESLRVGTHQTGLAVGQPFLAAELADQSLRPAQARSRHRREQVVLNLVVQAAEGKVGEPASANIARCENLTAEEVVLVLRSQDRHALVVRSERGSQVQAEQALLYQDEDDRLQGAQHDEHNGKETGDVQREQNHLGRPAPGGAAGQSS